MTTTHPFTKALLFPLIVTMPMTGFWAQTDTLQMDVTFVGNRQMEVRDAVKLSSWPTARPLSVNKPTLSYELLSRRLQFVPQMTPIEATRLRVDPSLSRLYRGYIRAAGGTRGTSMVDASYTDLRSRDGSWGTAFHHAATSSPSALLTGRLNENSLNAWVSRFVGKEKMSFDASAGSERVLMYGFDSLQVDSALTPIDAPSVMWSHATLGASFKSHKKRDKEMNHEIDATLGWLRNERGTHERSFGLSATLDKALGEVRGQFDVDVQLDEYGATEDVSSNQAIVVVEPSVSTRKGALNAKAGLGLAIDADQPTRDGLGDAFHLYPRAEVSLSLLRNLFVPYGKIGGDLTANNFHSLTQQNPFYAPSTLGPEIPSQGFRSTNKRLALSGGIRGTVTDAFRFHGYFSTASHEDYVLFRLATSTVDSVTINTFEAVYDTLAIRTLGGEAEFDLGSDWSFAGGVKFLKYDTRSELRAWNLPRATWNARATYSLIDGLDLSTSLAYIGERFSILNDSAYGDTQPLDDGAYELSLPGFLDVNFTADYTYNDRLGAWLTLANLANAKYAEWGGFPVQGFQALAGVHYAF